MTPIITVLIIVLAILLLYVGFIAAPGIIAGRKVFSRQNQIEYTDADYQNSYYQNFKNKILENGSYFSSLKTEHLKITAEDGIGLYCDYYPNKEADQLVVFVHGYRSTPLFNFATQARDLYEAGYAVAFIRQRGYSAVEGNRIGFGLLEYSDVLLWTKYFVSEKQVTRMVVYGVSMGGTTVGYAASQLDEKHVKGLILDCTFCSPYEQIKRTMIKRHLPEKLLMPYLQMAGKMFLHRDLHQDILKPLAVSNLPVLLFQGTGDTTVPVSDAQLCEEAIGERGHLMLVEGAEHTLAYLTGKEMTKAQLCAFVQKCFKEDTPDE